MLFRSSVLLALMVWAVISLQPILNCSANQEAAESFTREQMTRELQRLGKVCDQLGLQAQSELCSQWLLPERKDQHRLFLPDDFPAESGKKDIDSWRGHFIAARKKYADYLFAQAKTEASAGDEEKGYRLLWQTLRENPEHVEARRVLGSLVTGLSGRPQSKNNYKVNELAALGTVTRWQSANFLLYSRANAKQSLDLAARLEQFHILWTQVFYQLWAPRDLLKRRLAGGNDPWPDYERVKVVMLGTRAEYLKLLGGTEENIGLSVGYYNPTVRMSIFYPADDLDETLNHELTHQLFSEISQVETTATLEKVEGAWCIEGLALYMESLASSPEGWTVGGLDAKRLQTARYRALRDEYWPLWESWCKGSLLNWKASSEIALMYSHAAGLTHLFMDLLPEQSGRQPFMDYVRTVYSGRQMPGELLKLLGGSEQNAQNTYRSQMTINDLQLQSLANNPQHVKQLVLCRSQLEDWEILSKFTQLTWLDLSYSNISQEKSKWISDLKNLRRLSLESTKLDSSIMPAVSQLRKLTELDLSLCGIDDRGLAALVSHASLETLWLAGTKVTEKSLPTIATMPNLTHCDVSSTVIDGEPWESFVAKNPRFKKK